MGACSRKKLEIKTEANTIKAGPARQKFDSGGNSKCNSEKTLKIQSAVFTMNSLTLLTEAGSMTLLTEAGEAAESRSQKSKMT